MSSSGIHGRMVKNDAGNLSALDLAVGVLWQLVQHPHEVRQLEWSNAARERGGQARRVYRRAGDVFPQHNRRPDPIADLIVWNGKDTSFLESPQSEDCIFQLTRRDQYALALEAVVRATHDVNVAVAVHAREIAGDEPAAATGCARPLGYPRKKPG